MTGSTQFPLPGDPGAINVKRSVSVVSDESAFVSPNRAIAQSGIAPPRRILVHWFRCWE